VEQYARYRAPAESGQKLVSPPWHDLPAIVAANRRWSAGVDLEIAGRSLAEFAADARRELATCAAKYVATYHQPITDINGGDVNDRPLIFAGHQPEIVHPGVWVKNFAAGALADALGGTAINLVIDADACRSTAIRAPSGAVEEPRFASIEFDAPSDKVPWEERPIVNVDVWQSFAERVREATSSLLQWRMLDDWWPIALERGETTGRIGAALAQARHLAELDWGGHSLELPQSRMCASAAFRRFACQLLRGLPRFIDAYNGALNEYRRAHGIRNHAQPVPNLAARDSWLQAPFWIWSGANPRRRAVYARREREGLVLSDLGAFSHYLPVSHGGELDDAVSELGRLEEQGLKLRSRALVTTMFARLAAADLFIHGIGGAKYDEVTDAICRRFFGTCPPRFAAISGTLRLPISHAAASEAHVRELRQSLRELNYHPERFVDFDGKLPDRQLAVAFAVEKRQWIQIPKTLETAAPRHAGIVAANRSLQPFVAGRRQQLESELERASRQSRANRILDSREYAFCLYPPNLLKQFLLDFPPGVL
jgi:hypothetical protein